MREYFPPAYHDLADDLWDFRNALVHAFSTGNFLLTHHRSDRHFERGAGHMVSDRLILNAENFYGALLTAAERYFADVRRSSDLQDLLVKRIFAAKGGGILTIRMVP